MLTEQMINQVEEMVKVEHPDGLNGLISTVFILCTNGKWLSHPNMDPNPLVAAHNVMKIKITLSLLNAHRKVAGVVQVTSGWALRGKLRGSTHEKMVPLGGQEVLMFNATGRHGVRVRVYEVHKHNGKRLPDKLAGTFGSLKALGFEEGGE